MRWNDTADFGGHEIGHTYSGHLEILTMFDDRLRRLQPQLVMAPKLNRRTFT